MGVAGAAYATIISQGVSAILCFIYILKKYTILKLAREDILEEIVGEIHDEYDEHEEEYIRKMKDREYIIKGFVSLNDLNDELDLDLESEDFDSIGGLIIDKLNRLPQLHDRIVLEDGTILEVHQLLNNRIEEVHLILPEVVEEENEKVKEDK